MRSYRTLIFRAASGLLLLAAGAESGRLAAAPPKPKTLPVTRAEKAPVVRPMTLPPVKAVAPPPMWSVAYSPDGSHIAVGSYRHLLLFDAATGSKSADYLISTDAIRSVAFSADGKQIAAATGVADRSGSVILLDAATGQVVRTIKSHDDTIEAVAWDGVDLVTPADDETVGIDDSATGKSVASLTEHIGRCLSVAIPVKTTPAAGGSIFATGGADKAVKIWDGKLRRVVVNFDQSTGPVWCLVATPRAGEFVAGSDDGKVRLFAVRADGERRQNAPASEPDPRTGYLAREQTAHQGAVYALAASPDGAHIVSGGADGKVIVWDGAIGGRQKTLDDSKKDIWSVAISPDSKQFAATSLDGRTRIYDFAKGALLMTLDSHGVVAPPAPLATAPDSKAPIYGPFKPARYGPFKPALYGPFKPVTAGKATIR